MANPRDDKSTQNIEDTARVASERATDRARMGQVAAEAGDEVARAGAQLLQQNAETVQNAWRFGLDMATKVMGRSTRSLVAPSVFRETKRNMRSRLLNARPATPKRYFTPAQPLPE